MTTRIALAIAAACMTAAAAYASRDRADTKSPIPPLIDLRPAATARPVDAEDPPEPQPGQVMGVATSSDGHVITTIWAAPPAPPGTIAAQFEGAPRANDFSVDVALEQPIEAGEEALAKQVKKVLRQQRPNNPGRARSFVQLERGEYPLTQVGWAMQIKSAQRIPRGWRATIWVFAQVRYGQEAAGFAHHHIEVYRFQGGKLTLESESTRPGWDPSQPNGWIH